MNSLTQQNTLLVFGQLRVGGPRLGTWEGPEVYFLGRVR